uniref:Uncharacterized protein n=1 Tax=Lepeophtheirus salmonis TaxID=72036 RepID=A0A0K2UXE5_LEPSM
MSLSHLKSFLMYFCFHY